MLEEVFLEVLKSIRLSVALDEVSIVNDTEMLFYFSKKFVINEECFWCLVTILPRFDETVFLFQKY